jgi:IS5 family transposase
VQKKRPDAGNGGRAFAFGQPQRRKPMSDKLQRMLDKAKTRHAKETASDAILIDCDRPEDVPRRVDVLIAAGKLTEEERPRCVFWPLDWTGTHDEWVLMMDRNTTPEDIRRQVAGSAARAHAAVMADPILAAYYRKKGWA